MAARVKPARYYGYAALIESFNDETEEWEQLFDVLEEDIPDLIAGLALAWREQQVERRQRERT